MYSDRPASEVLASVAVSAGQTQNAIPMPKTKREVVLPSHHGVMVSSLLAMLNYVQLHTSYFQGTAIFDYVPAEAMTAYVYTPPTVTTYGPGVPAIQELERDG